MLNRKKISRGHLRQTNEDAILAYFIRKVVKNRNAKQAETRKRYYMFQNYEKDIIVASMK